MPRFARTGFLRRIFAKITFAAAFAAAVAAPALVSTPLLAQGPYKVLAKWNLGGEGGWDYLTADPGAHRLYITHGTRVEVVDSQTGKSIGAITGLQGIHGVALDDSGRDDAGRYGYISDGKANAVVVFDRSTLSKVAAIPAGNGPDGILFEPATKTVWAFNGHSRNVTVIDTATQKVVATIPLPGKPEFPAADGKGNVYDNIEDKSEIVRLDARAKTLTATWPAGCEGPSGLAIDAKEGHLFAVCDKTMSVVDTKTGKVLATPAIGDGPDAARFSAKHRLAFASCGEGVLAVVNTAAPGFPTIEMLPTQSGARTMAYDPMTDRAYVVTAQFGPRPAATAQNPRPRPSVLPGSFTVIVVGR